MESCAVPERIERNFMRLPMGQSTNVKSVRMDDALSEGLSYLAKSFSFINQKRYRGNNLYHS